MKQLLLSLCLLTVFLCGCGNSSSTTSASTPTATAKPTVKLTQPLNNPTPMTAQAGPTTLGQPLSHFIAQYGQPNDHTDTSAGSYHFRSYGGSNIDFLIIHTDILDGSSYSQSIYGISVQASDAGWTESNADANCDVFLPQDSVYKSQILTSFGGNYDKIYYSPSLANLFPASEFYDADQNPVKAGTFDVLYIVKSQSDPTTIVGCDIGLGTQGTK